MGKKTSEKCEKVKLQIKLIGIYSIGKKIGTLLYFCPGNGIPSPKKVQLGRLR
jgi:hypothetical protein